MTVTNDERHEVVARLRDFENLRPIFKDSVLCGFLEALDVGYLDWEGVCNRLADLIEPEPEPEPEKTYTIPKETVEVDIERHDNELHFSCPQCGEYLGVSYEYLEERTTPVDKMLCQYCGYSIVYQDGDDIYTWDYCPHCGARIVKE